MTLTRLSAALLALLISITPGLAAGLGVNVDGVHNNKGNVLVLVFDNAEAFKWLEWRYAVGFAKIPARKGSLSHQFKDLKDGPYAVFAFHDENGDEDLNYEGERFLEGAGASGAHTADAVPNFSQAAVKSGNTRVKLFYE